MKKGKRRSYKKHLVLRRNPHFLTPISQRAKRWTKENVGYEGWQKTGESIAIESRMADDIREGMIEAGMKEGKDFSFSGFGSGMRRNCYRRNPRAKTSPLLTIALLIAGGLGLSWLIKRRSQVSEVATEKETVEATTEIPQVVDITTQTISDTFSPVAGLGQKMTRVYYRGRRIAEIPDEPHFGWLQQSTALFSKPKFFFPYYIGTTIKFLKVNTSSSNYRQVYRNGQWSGFVGLSDSDLKYVRR